ncbi:MAG: hypothetical protein ACO3HF_01035 [Burkholderiaceae bacterium]
MTRTAQLFTDSAELLEHLQYLRTFVWDADPSDVTLWEMADEMAADGVLTEDQVDAWLAELT